MQKVQEVLDFPIDTPSDEELQEQFEHEHRRMVSQREILAAASTIGMMKHSGFEKELTADILGQQPRKSYSAKTKNQKKRARKAQRKARKATA